MSAAQFRVAVAGAAAVLCGCSTVDQVPTTVDSGRKTIARSFDVREIRRGTDGEMKPATTLVDYKSAMVFRPRRSDLARSIGVDLEARSSLSPEQVAEYDRQIEKARKALTDVQQLQSLVSAIAEYQRKSVALHAEEVAPGALVQNDPAWRELKVMQGEIVSRATELATVFVNYRDHDGLLNPDDLTDEARDAMEEAIEAVYTSISPPPVRPQQPQEFVPEVVSQHLNETMELVSARLQELADLVLAKAPEAELEMEAHLRRGEETLPVTISPYTIVEGVDRGSKSPRVGVPSKADLDKVQASYAEYKKLSKSLNELQELAGDQDKLRELERQLKVAFETAGEDLGKGLLTRLERIAKVDGATATKITSIMSHASALQTDLKNLRDAWRKFRASTQSSPVLLAQAVGQLLGEIEKQSLIDHLTKLAGSLGSIPESVQGDARRLLVETRELLAKEKDALLKTLTGIPAAGGIASAYSSLQGLRAIARTRSFGDVKPGRITKNPIDLRVAEDGVVDLNRTPAEVGDQLEITYRLSKNLDDDGPDRRTYVANESLDVRKFGYYSTLKSQILFYDRMSDGSSTYSAAPGISYNLHYRPEGGQAFFDAVAPGLGISVSAPNFENGTELAIGAQLTLFNDMLQVGYAHNISVEDDPGMFYFGLDLIGVFQGGR